VKSVPLCPTFRRQIEILRLRNLRSF